MKILKEGNLSTGLWKRYCKLENGLMLVMITSGVINPNTVDDPERGWAGILFSNETDDDLNRVSLQSIIDDKHQLWGMVSISSSPVMKDVFVFKEAVADSVISHISALDM